MRTNVGIDSARVVVEQAAIGGRKRSGQALGGAANREHALHAVVLKQLRAQIVVVNE